MVWASETDGLAATAGEPRLAAAVKDRDEATVAALLQQRTDVDAPLADGATALHWAVHWNDAKTVERLLRAGANANARNRYGATPLWMATSEGNVALVKMLLDAGADARTPALGGESVLMTAARTGNPAARARKGPGPRAPAGAAAPGAPEGRRARPLLSG